VSEQDARRCLVPSGTSLLGLVKHLMAVEWAWFLYSFAGESAAGPDEPVSGADTIDGVLTAYRPMVRRCNDDRRKRTDRVTARQARGARGGNAQARRRQRVSGR
jgi:hypothetical protein